MKLIPVLLIFILLASCSQPAGLAKGPGDPPLSGSESRSAGSLPASPLPGATTSEPSEAASSAASPTLPGLSAVTPSPCFPGSPAKAIDGTSPCLPTSSPSLLRGSSAKPGDGASSLSPASPISCLSQGGRFETGSLPAEMLPEPLDFRIYLPPCYDQQPSRRYPTLYLIHGQSYTDDQWERLGAGKTADSLIAAGEASPFLIVMPRDRRWDQPTEDHFGEAVVNVLIPWIDSHYPTLADRHHRAVGGLSRGAGWAVHLALTHPELFDTLGAHCLPIFWTDTYSLKAWLDAIPPDQMPRIYMDNPDNERPEIMDSSRWFEDLLTRRGIPHEWHLFTGFHDEKYWSAHVEQYLRWYVAGWK